jgi:hypothetical protein
LARENRQKRKQYVKKLEDDLSVSTKVNDSLKQKMEEKDAKIKQLESEVVYLKSILANVPEISSLITTIKRGSSLPVSSSFAPPPNKKIKMETCNEITNGRWLLENEDIGYNNEWLPSSPLLDDADFPDVIPSSTFSCQQPLQDPYLFPQSATGEARAGVCVHVMNKKISLEFCSTCSSRALENWAKEA